MDVVTLSALLRNRVWIPGVLFALLHWQAAAQNCDCPPVSSCAPCSGGINNLTLRYNGVLLPAVITALDGGTVVYNAIVGPGAEFSFDGSLPDGRFVANQVTLAVDGIYNTVINVNCGVAVFVGSTYGSFTVKSGTSQLGGPLCCSATSMDKIAPVLSNCPVNITVSTGISCASTVSWSPPTVSDNCNAYTLTSSHTPGSLFSLGITSVTYTATDNFGNSSSCSFQVNVVDNTPPSITNCPQNITAYANASCRATVNWAAPSATDNCSLQSFTSNYNPGSSFLIGTSIVSYTATDNAGNTSTCSFTVTVVDNSPPVFSSCPSAITVPGSDDCQAVVSWPVPVATDNCSVTVTTNHNSGESFPIGTTAVTYTATDGSGNKSVCTFNVTVTDNTSPIFTLCPADINLSADDACEMPVTWDLPIATDNCDITLTSNHNPGELFTVGITEVEYKATDNYGNASYCTFTVTIESNERPQLTGCPSDINAEADESGSVSVTWTPPAATSTCSEVELTSSHDPGDIFPVGTTKVEYVARDASNNETTCSFNVVVAYKEVTLDVVQLVTPNGDGINDEWIIKNLEQFSKNKVTVVDRWGSLIYNASGYNNNDIVWKGINANGQPAPTGTYFYTIEVHFRDRQVKQTGFIELVQ